MRVMAHRGFSSRAPENTLSAFQMAIDFGANGLETDVHLSKDGEVVICHDEHLGRTVKGQGFVKDHTVAELKQMDAGGWYSEKFKGEPIPTLEELLRLIQGKDVLMNIELKTGLFEYPEIEEKVIGLLKKYDLVDQSIISSFNHYSLRRIKQLLPELKTGMLVFCRLYEPWKYALAVKADALHCHWSSIVPEVVQGAKENGLILNPFTVNQPEDIRRMIELGVNGIISDFPDRVLDELKRS